MTIPSPLTDRHRDAGASFLRYGDGDDAAPVVETFGELEIEYASIRKSCALVDLPHRATLRCTGEDRLEFLERMITQDLTRLAAGRSTDSFWLNRQGRIVADLRLASLDDELLIDLDALAAEDTRSSLDSYLFAEDMTLADATADLHRLALHGPRAAELLLSVAERSDDEPAAIESSTCRRVTIGGRTVVVDRNDTTGDIGLLLTAGAEDVETVWTALAETDGVRPAGWHAYNIARIEAGTPLFNLDFGPSSLPAETGLALDRVSFTKGCYLGQEIVARMHNLGHPKQTLVALRLAGAGPEPDWQPSTGAGVLIPGAEVAVGAVTSSTRSPMLSDAVICLAQVKWDHSEAGTTLEIETARGRTAAEVQPGLAFWKRA